MSPSTPSFTEYRAGLEAAGFSDIEITPTHAVADGMHSAIVRATKPNAVSAARSATQDTCCGVTDCCTPTEQATYPSTTVSEAKGAAGCACQN